MKISVHKRTGGKKGETQRIRREGNIPAILYGVGVEPEAVYLKGEEWQTLSRQLEPGLLATQRLEFEWNGVARAAVVKEIQYHFATYAVEHLDLQILSEEVPVAVNVPIQCLGVADCTGIKLGGFLRQVIRSLKVRCLPRHIPKSFVVDIKDMGLGESRRLSDLAIPEGVQPLGKMNEVALVIAKKAGA